MVLINGETSGINKVISDKQKIERLLSQGKTHEQIMGELNMPFGLFRRRLNLIVK